jgi:hypothetical protein
VTRHGPAARHLAHRISRWSGWPNTVPGFGAQLELACRFLDVTEDITGVIVATRVADALYEAFTGDGPSGWAQRNREALAKAANLQPPGGTILPRGGFSESGP